jgi:hypothetical protein
VPRALFDDGLDLENYPELEEVNAGFQLSLEAHGTTHRPSWLVYLSSTLGKDQHLALSRYAKQRSNALRAFHSYPPLDSDRGRPLFPLRLMDSEGWWLQTPHQLTAGADTPTTLTYRELGPAPIEDWPLDVPVPLLLLGEVDQVPAWAFTDAMSTDEIQGRTLQLVAAGAGGRNAPVEGADETEVVLAAGVESAVKKVESDANRILSQLAEFPFELQFQVGNPSDWFVGSIPRWVAIPHIDAELALPLEELSFSQNKWARFALSLCLRGGSSGGKPMIIMLDEPEQGLHRQLETRVAEGVTSLSGMFPNVAILGATHSPAFLDPRRGATLLHLTLTGEGETLVVPLDLGVGSRYLDEESKRLGISVADIVSLTRVVLLVEGTHDQIVVEHFLKQELKSSGARVFVMRGTDHAVALPDAQFIFDALDAPIIVVLDNVIQADVSAFWKQAQQAVSAGNPKQAERTLAALSLRKSKEERTLGELGIKALQVGRLNRIVPFGLAKRDVLDYLPPESLGVNVTWEAAKVEWKRQGQSNEKFKNFLRRKYNAIINAESVELAARSIKTIPDDFRGLGILAQQLGHLGAIDDLEGFAGQVN